MGSALYLLHYFKHDLGAGMDDSDPAGCSATIVYNIQDGAAVNVLFEPDGDVPADF